MNSSRSRGKATLAVSSPGGHGRMIKEINSSQQGGSKKQTNAGGRSSDILDGHQSPALPRTGKLVRSYGGLRTLPNKDYGAVASRALRDGGISGIWVTSRDLRRCARFLHVIALKADGCHATIDRTVVSATIYQPVSTLHHHPSPDPAVSFPPSLWQFQCGGCFLHRRVNLVFLTLFRILNPPTFARTVLRTVTVESAPSLQPELYIHTASNLRQLASVDPWDPTCCGI